MTIHRQCFPEQGWKTLKGMKEVLARHNAVLAGGTALALRIGHRISRDLDFFTTQDFQNDSVISEIRKKGLHFQVISEGKGTLILDIEGIRVSLLRYDYGFLQRPSVQRGIRIAGVLDIASMKVIALSQRGTRRDFIDLYFILQDIPFYKITDHMVRHFGKERINPVHIGKSMVYFSDADSEPEPAYMRGKGVSWERVKKFFRAHVKQFVYDLEVARAGD